MTRALVIATYVAVGALVAALAVYLLVIVAGLVRIGRNAGRVLEQLERVAESVAPVGGLVRQVNGELEGTRASLGEAAGEPARGDGIETGARPRVGPRPRVGSSTGRGRKDAERTAAGGA